MKKIFNEFSYNTEYNDIQQKIINERESHVKSEKKLPYIFIPIFTSLAVITFIVTFTVVKSTNKNNTASDNIAINSSDDIDNIDDKDNDYLISCIPEEITINNKIYSAIEESDKYEPNVLIGYIVNSEKKSETLKNTNQSLNLFYIVDYSYYDKDSDSIGKFYSIVDYDNLSIIGLQTSEIWVYYKANE